MAKDKKPTKTDEQEAEAEAKKQKIEDQEKKESLSDYQKRMGKVKQLKLLTDTEGWKQLYSYMSKSIANHAEGVLDYTLSTKEVMYHQQSVRVLRDLINRVRSPIDALTSFAEEMPLFATNEISERAEWDSKTGTVTIR